MMTNVKIYGVLRWQMFNHYLFEKWVLRGGWCWFKGFANFHGVNIPLCPVQTTTLTSTSSENCQQFNNRVLGAGMSGIQHTIDYVCMCLLIYVGS